MRIAPHRQPSVWLETANAVVQPELSSEQAREMSVDWFAKDSFRPLRLREFTLLQRAGKFHLPRTRGRAVSTRFVVGFLLLD